MPAIAAAVEDGATPSRLARGCELVLSKRSMLATTGAIAPGLTAGAMPAREWIGED